MNTFKMILLTALCSSVITGCSCANRNHENTTSTEPPSATEKATSTPDTNKNDDTVSDAAGNIIDDAGNMVEDAGDAVGNAVDSVGNAVKE